jgi:hypothetical protein
MRHASCRKEEKIEETGSFIPNIALHTLIVTGPSAHESDLR